VTDELHDIESDTGLLQFAALRSEINRTSAVGIRDNRRDTLRKKRSALTESFAPQSLGGVRVHVNEPRSNQSIADVDDVFGLRGRQSSDGGDPRARDSDVCPPPRIA
jgi:hypothetical protein